VAESSNTVIPEIADSWKITSTIDPASGKVESVGIIKNGNVVIGGDSFVACYDPELRMLWNNKTDKPVTANINFRRYDLYRYKLRLLRLLNSEGRKIGEWVRLRIVQ